MTAPQRSRHFVKTGHAPGHIRECLLNALDIQADWWKNLEMDFLRDSDQRWWDKASPLRHAHWIIEQLWHCADIVPGLERRSVMDWLADQEYFTYSQLVRALKEDLDERVATPQESQTSAS